MPKIRTFPKGPRYILETKTEMNSLDKPIEVYYIVDTSKGKHGQYIARMYDQWAANTSLEALNKKRK